MELYKGCEKSTYELTKPMQMTFYPEWLHLDKNEFRIMAMLADKGNFHGSLSNLCEYFSLSKQTSNRNRLKCSIQKLSEEGFLTCKLVGQTYDLCIIPKGEALEMPRKWAETLMKRDYTTESVAWEQVLKVYLWIAANKNPVVTNNEIAEALNISTSTIVSAKNVLEHEYAAITRDKVSKKLADGWFITVGQELVPVAWWNIK